MKIGKYYHYVIMRGSVIIQWTKKEFANICMPDVKIGLDGRKLLGKNFTQMHILA